MPGVKFFCEGLTPDMVKRAEKELGETEEIKTKTLSELKNLIKCQPDFHPCMDDAFLLRFLRVKKFQTNRAFEMLQKYYRFKARYSGSISDLNPSDIRPILEQGQSFFLETREHNDIAVGLTRIGHYDITKFSPDDLIAAAFIFFEVGLIPDATQALGAILCYDLDNFNWRMIKHYASPSLWYKIIDILEGTFPVRMKAIHIINEPLYVDAIYKIVCMFMSEKLKKRIYFHGKDLNSFHKSIPAEILPQEYGGTLGPMSKLAENFAERILSYENYFNKMKEYGYRGQTLEKLQK